MVAPILERPISDLTRRYINRVKKVQKEKSKQKPPRRLWPFTWEDVYEALANQSSPEVTGPLVIGLRMAPKLIAPLYLGAKLGKLVGTAGAEGTFGSGPGVGLERTPEIARYEDSAIGTSRII